MKMSTSSPSNAVRIVQMEPRETVLIVDDQPALCEVGEILLSRCGYHVLTAHNAGQAKAMVRRNPHIDLLLTDIEMPGMLGDELAEWFRVRNPHAAVVFMSGNPMQRRRLEAYPFIEKPFVRLDALVNTVRGALTRTRVARQATIAAA
jgi:CheY-like chemotaxis protein